MVGLIVIFIFAVLMAIPGFYIITRKMFPRQSKRSSAWITLITTAVFIAGLALLLLGNWPE